MNDTSRDDPLTLAAPAMVLVGVCDGYDENVAGPIMLRRGNERPHPERKNDMQTWKFGMGTPIPPRESIEKVQERKLAKVRAERDALRAALLEVERMVADAVRAPETADRWLDRIEETARVALAPKGDEE